MHTRSLPGLIIPLAGLLAVAACGSPAARRAPDATSAVKGGTLTFAVNTEPTCLDPHQSPQDVAGLFTRPALDSLVSLDAQGGIHPWLATSWKVSDDQKSYTFTLRKGVTFSDGTPFDAAAVKANLDHVVDPATKSQLAAGFIAPYTGSDVIGDHTVRVTLSRPYSPFLSALSTAYLGMESPASLKRPQDALCRHVVGSGPFVIDAWTPKQGITYHRNPRYDWQPADAGHKGEAYVDRLDIKVIPENSVRVGALTSGQVDAVASVPPVDLPQVKADPDLTVEVRRAPGGNYNYYPNTSSGVFTDKRVRQAFRDGIDFATIVRNLYFGAYQPAFSPLSPATSGYDKGTESQWRYDPAEAARLLDAAGWTGRDADGYRTKDGRRLTVRWRFNKATTRESRDTLSEQVQAEARKLGVDVAITNPASTGDAVAAYIRGDYDLADFSWQRADGDALRNLFSIGSISTPERYGQNAARYSGKEVDGWLNDALGTTDPGERAALYAKVQRKVTEEAVVFPVYTFNALLGVSKRVHGIGWEAQAFPTFYDAWVVQG